MNCFIFKYIFKIERLLKALTNFSKKFGFYKITKKMYAENAIIENLDKEFEEYCQKFQNYVNFYDFREKFLITEWLEKLKSSNTNLEEKKLRNRFIKHFVESHEAKVNLFSAKPFNEIPKNFAGPLSGLKNLFVSLNFYKRSNYFYLQLFFFSPKILKNLSIAVKTKNLLTYRICLAHYRIKANS